MGLIAKTADVVSTLLHIPTLLVLKKAMRPRSPDECDCYGAQVQRNAKSFPDRTAILFEDRTVTWAAFNALSNRYANAFKSLGLARGDSVSLFMENRIEYLAVVVALNKLGAPAALINTNLRGEPLVHCLAVTGARVCVFGEELMPAIAEIRAAIADAESHRFLFVADSGATAAPAWSNNLDALAEQSSENNPPETAQTTLGEQALFVFTSGTTGMPKAAVLSNRRFLNSAGLSHRAGLRCSERDRLYMCLPLYHLTPMMVGMGAAFSSGASTFLRRQFSASSLLDELRTHDANRLIYIGELCRYLMATPAAPGDHVNPLEAIMGNGLRPDIWMAFKHRFGIRRITEFYGSSEGNVAFANLLNKDCTIGMTAATVALIRYDVDADQIVTDALGRCVRVAKGEPGLLLGQINDQAVFEGYTNAEATEQKILRDVFEDGDAWFNSGDLLKEVEAGFTLGYTHYQFVDRVGDTFRWKAENVSTNEVGELLNDFRQVKIANVYGVEVPNAEGRAGMAALVLNDGAGDLDIEGFSSHVMNALPHYARPVFVRVQADIDVTGTFKMTKGDLRKQGYDLDQITDPIYVWKPGDSGYSPLDHDFLQRIRAGAAGF